MTLIVPYLPLNPLLPRPKGDKDAEGMKKQIPSNNKTRNFCLVHTNSQQRDMVQCSLPLPAITFRCLLFVPFVGMLSSPCLGQFSRNHFAIPDKVPLFQVVVDLDSAFEWKDHQRKPLEEILADFKSPKPSVSAATAETSRTTNLLSGLMVPITEDGYCLTAAHNLGKGDAMSSFRSQINQQNFGEVYTIVDLRNEDSPPFFQFEPNGGRMVVPTRKGSFKSNRFVAAQRARRIP